jgi:hypothetical protein
MMRARGWRDVLFWKRAASRSDLATRSSPRRRAGAALVTLNTREFERVPGLNIEDSTT